MCIKFINIKLIALTVSFLALFTALAGCGFALRGTNTKPLSDLFANTYLNVSLTEQQYLNAQLRQTILSNGGVLVPKSDAKVSIDVSPLSKSSRQIAVSSNNFLKQYENTYSIKVDVYDLKNNILLGSQTVSTMRYVQSDDRQVLSSQEQDAVATNAAIRDLSQSILRYLMTF